MLEVTLDNNCIIDLEKKNSSAIYLWKLIEKHNERKIHLRITAITACERTPDQTYVSHLDEFKERLTVIGLDNVEILPTLCYAGLGFLGYSLCSGGKASELEAEIQRILFPSTELEYPDFCKKRGLDLNDKKAWRGWVNKKCDVLALWSHIWFKGDVFSTRDKKFHRKAERLIELGAGKILTPFEALALVDQVL